MSNPHSIKLYYYYYYFFISIIIYHNHHHYYYNPIAETEETKQFSLIIGSVIQSL